MSQIEFEQTVQQWQEYQDKPWLRFNMTESEYREYEDEYAEYLDNIRFTGNTLRDRLAVLNARESKIHEQKRQAALDRIKQLRIQQRKKEVNV
jgi:hypothetical protein